MSIMQQLKRTISILLIVATILLISVPAFAATTASEAETEALQQEIDELIRLAGKAARDGNYNLANSYEDRIEALGTEILTYGEMRGLVAEMSGIAPLATDVNPPPGSSYVRFYKTTHDNFKYNSNFYDIITIEAVSWSDESGFLHKKGEVLTKQPSSYELTSSVASTLLSKTVVGGVLSPIMSISNYFQKIGQSMSNYTEMNIETGDGVCVYAIDMNVKFQWIRPHGNGDYVLRVRDACYPEINYSVTILAALTDKYGKTKSKPASRDIETESIPPNYGDLNKVCQAYLNDKIVEYPCPTFTIAVGTTTVSIAPMPVPPYMEII